MFDRSPDLSSSLAEISDALNASCLRIKVAIYVDDMPIRSVQRGEYPHGVFFFRSRYPFVRRALQRFRTGGLLAVTALTILTARFGLGVLEVNGRYRWREIRVGVIHVGCSLPLPTESLVGFPWTFTRGSADLMNEVDARRENNR